MLKKFSHVNPTKADEIPSRVIKQCSTVLAPFLTIFFNCFVSSNIFSSHLKFGTIVPIHKIGSGDYATNYLPVVILSVIGIIFESLVLDGLSFDVGKYIIPEEHGFR